MASKTIKATKKSGAKDTGRAASQSNGPLRQVTKKAWHITDFQDLFELSDDIRKGRSGPLRYTKSHVCLSPFAPDAEARYFERMRLLKARPERHLLRSTFEDLKNWTSAKQFGPRGFLVTSESKPATIDYLAAQLNLDIEDVKQALPLLEQLGFLERISMNGQTESDKPKRKPARKSRKNSVAKKTKKSPKKTKRKNKRKAQNAAKDTVGGHEKRPPDSNGLKRFNPARAGNPSRNGKAKSKDKNKGKVNHKATGDKTTVAGRKKNNGNSKLNANAQSKSNTQVNPKQQAEQQQPEPIEPNESNALRGVPPNGGCKSSQASLRTNNGPSCNIWPTSGEYDAGDLVYGRRVYLALGFNGDIDAIEARREITSFASVWHKCRQQLSGLSPPDMDRLGMRGLNEAKRIARYCQRNKRRANPGAVWNDLMGKLAAAQQQRSPP